jgi:hypothetical protein
MKFAKSILTGTGAVVLAGLILALLAPKAAHGIAATAVQVMNTSAAPAITADTSKLVSQIVNLQCPNPNPGAVFIIYGCYTVPAGQNLVVTSMTVTPLTGPGAAISLNPSGLPTIVSVVTPGSVSTQYSWAQGLVFPSGHTIDISMQGPVNVYFTGYLTAN